MKNYTITERQEHVENWKSGTVSKAAYAKAAGLHPTTFYTWVRKAGKLPGFVELPTSVLPRTANTPEIRIEKGDIKIHIPLGLGYADLRALMEALRGAL